jgi:hypothetical protein
LTAPPISWPQVLADLAQALRSTVGEPLARELNVPGVLLRCWLAGAEPNQRDRAMLLSRWRVLTMRPVEFVPRREVPRQLQQHVPAVVAEQYPGLLDPLVGPLAGPPQPMGATASCVHKLREAAGAWVAPAELRPDAARPDVTYTPQVVSSVLAKLQDRHVVEGRFLGWSGSVKLTEYRWCAAL